MHWSKNGIYRGTTSPLQAYDAHLLTWISAVTFKNSHLNWDVINIEVIHRWHFYSLEGHCIHKFQNVRKLSLLRIHSEFFAWRSDIFCQIRNGLIYQGIFDHPTFSMLHEGKAGRENINLPTSNSKQTCPLATVKSGYNQNLVCTASPAWDIALVRKFKVAGTY